jgi:hypothetical protein
LNFAVKSARKSKVDEKILIDTNILISAAYSKKGLPRQALKLCHHRFIAA